MEAKAGNQDQNRRYLLCSEHLFSTRPVHNAPEIKIIAVCEFIYTMWLQRDGHLRLQ